MPELPEVETIVEQLRHRVVGRSIKRVQVLDTGVADAELKKAEGRKISFVRRRAKYLVFGLSGEFFLLMHLGLTGNLQHLLPGRERSDLSSEKFVRARLYLDDSSQLVFNDIRKFGSVRFLTPKELDQALGKIGPEPLSKEFTVQDFKELLRRKKGSPIKVALMDQGLIAGIGNIYAQEMLYHAGIDPRRKISSLSEREVEKLYREMKSTLSLAVKHHGTTVQDYVHIEGTGGFQRFLSVYQKEKCPLGHRLEKISLGGRGTSFCRKCQK